MISYKKLNMAYIVMIPVSITLCISLSFLALQVQSKGGQIIQKVAERELAAIAGTYGNTIKGFFDVPISLSHEIAISIAMLKKNNTPLTREQVIVMLQSIIHSNSSVFAAAVAFEDNAFDNDDISNFNKYGSDANGRFTPHVDAEKITTFGNFENNSLYKVPKNDKIGILTNPYLHAAAGISILTTTASAPVIIDNEFKGTVLFDIPLENIAKLVSSIKVYKSGMAELITGDGTYVTNIDPDKVMKNIFDISTWSNDRELKASLDNGEEYVKVTEQDGESLFYYFYPIEFPLLNQTWFLIISVPVDEVLAEVSEITAITLYSCLGVLVLSLIVIFIVVRKAVRPLGILVNVAETISHGEYHVKIKTDKFGGETLALANSMKRMVDVIADNIEKAHESQEKAEGAQKKAEQATLIANEAKNFAEAAKREGILYAAAQLEGVVSYISVASEQLAERIEALKHGALEQASRIGQTSAAMVQMNSNVVDVASKAVIASEISSSTRAKAENGTAIVQSTVDGIMKVQSGALSLKSDMHTLLEQSQSISQIMNAISDIADQTNLLALNAAIEAARAGDAGRGFAVVADEVRKLAEKTMLSTSDVGNAIKSIQASVDTNIKQVDSSVELIILVTEQSNNSGQALQEIVELVDNTADQVQAIATSSDVQSATSNDINSALSEINDIAINAMQTVSEIAEVINGLATQAVQLSELVEKMKKH